MPTSDGDDPDPLQRILQPGPTAADLAAAETARALAAAVRHLRLPPERLPGWQALCSDEYAQAVRRLQAALGSACSTLALTAGTAS